MLSNYNYFIKKPPEHSRAEKEKKKPDQNEKRYCFLNGGMLNYYSL